MIRAVRPQPDVIILPELENPGILARLNTEFLAGLGYTTAIELDTTVTDLDRGIDVGILSRLPSAAPPTAHKVEFGNDTDLCRATRDIVAAPLALPDGRTLHLYAVHFPSGGNPIACRERAMRTLNALSAALPADAIAVAGGDFNFPCNEPQGDLFGRLLTEGRWNVPPEVRTGCDEPGSNKFRNTRPGNRSWFTWSFLDFFLVSDSLLTERPSPVGWFANLGSFRTAVVSAQQVETSDQGFVSPRRYDFEAGSGISDHWPVMIELVTTTLRLECREAVRSKIATASHGLSVAALQKLLEVAIESRQRRVDPGPLLPDPAILLRQPLLRRFQHSRQSIGLRTAGGGPVLDYRHRVKR